MTYTAHRITINNKMTERAELNNKAEMLDWVDSVFGKFAMIEILNNETGEWRRFTDVGDKFECIAQGINRAA
tara:strand:- start:58 stop:273 length:216 start_codon:yes stop_codon:yes gene_type:complete